MDPAIVYCYKLSKHLRMSIMKLIANKLIKITNQIGL